MMVALTGYGRRFNAGMQRYRNRRLGSDVFGYAVCFGYQLTRPGFWARQPSSEGKTVSISTRPRSPSNMCSTAERQAT